MELIRKRERLTNALTVIYFLLTFIVIINDGFFNVAALNLLKPAIPLVLMWLYFAVSEKKKVLFFIILILSSLTVFFLGGTTSTALIFGVVVSAVNRILMIYLVFALQKIKDFIPFFIATVPFLLFFFYLFIETEGIPQNSFYILILHNLLISLFAGIALSSYVMDDNKRNSILLICASFFVVLYFVVYVEKYFLKDDFEKLFKPLQIFLYVLAVFSLYKYLITAERSDNLNNNESS